MGVKDRNSSLQTHSQWADTGLVSSSERKREGKKEKERLRANIVSWKTNRMIGVDTPEVDAAATDERN